jgi:hypothetical protein
VFNVLNPYLASQSLPPDTPLLEPDIFPWARDFETNFQAIRVELEAILRRRAELTRFHDVVRGQSAWPMP